MKKYKVVLARTFLVSIIAETQEEAKGLAEFYLGDCSDLSNRKDREKERFLIEDIEMVYNEALEILDEQPLLSIVD